MIILGDIARCVYSAYFYTSNINSTNNQLHKKISILKKEIGA